VVYGIIKKYGGAINVQGEVGKGTEIHVYLSLLMETAEKREVEVTAHILEGKERILMSLPFCR
jgi:chemotaxis protein histidine kinase CheA